MDSSCPVSPTHCCVCGAPGPRAVSYGVSMGISVGAPGKTNTGDVSHYKCNSCGAAFALGDETLTVDGKVHTLHLSSFPSMAPPFHDLVTGPFWDASEKRREKPLAPIAPPADYKQRDNDYLRKWALSEVRRRAGQR
ncbi:MAG: hypothetical protein NTX53_20190 [candidate division WOR-3 bacterium]|nr:hypothetical protein [candidate division WOR-3 bacterium]